MAKELCGKMVTAHVKLDKDGEEQVSYKIKQHSQIAKLIAEEFQGLLGYDHQVQDWSHFDGHAWIPAPDGQAEELISGYFDREDWPVGTSDSCFRGSVSRLQKANYLKIPPAIHGVVPFQNGLFDLTTKNITPITHDNAQRWCLPYDYSATSGCPTFLAWLKSVFPNQARLKMAVLKSEGLIDKVVTREVLNQLRGVLVGDLFTHHEGPYPHTVCSWSVEQGLVRHDVCLSGEAGDVLVFALEIFHDGDFVCSAIDCTNWSLAWTPRAGDVFELTFKRRGIFCDPHFRWVG